MTWQDISTAPKDGTEIIVWVDWGVINTRWMKSPRGDCWDGPIKIIPTKWIPMPKDAPTANQFIGSPHGDEPVGSE